jgi:hypothetical protein
VRAISVLNAAAAAVPSRTLTSLVTFPALSNPQLLLPYLLLWGLLIFFGVRLLVRTGYGLFRFLVALVFGPVALILWAIPQTEWVTSVWAA